MLHHAAQFYQGLYSEKTSQAAVHRFLRSLQERTGFPNLPELNRPFTLEEVKSALSQAPSGKCSGSDGLPFEFYRKFKEQLAPILLSAFNWALESGEIPEEFSTGIIVLLYKKGDPEMIENYRPVTLLNCDYKILTTIINNRIRGIITDVVGPFQFGFTPGRSCADNAMTLQLCITKFKSEDEKQAGIVFLDFEKAYDRVSHEWLFSCMRYVNFPERLLSLIKGLYISANSRINMNNFLSPTFRIACGVRQGDGLSCALFNLAQYP